MFRKVFRFLAHWFTARTAHGIHSPFVFDFVQNVLPHKRTPLGERIDAFRRKLGRSTEKIEITDYGAGYSGKKEAVIRKSLGEVVGSSARSRREGALLYRICKHYSPTTCLELGTNLGFSTIYQMSGLAENAQFTTIEGAPSLADHARKNLKEFGFEPTVIVSTFSDALNELKLNNYCPDYVFIDGDHRYERVMAYFNVLLPMVSEECIMIFDDINWSAEMEKAWTEIMAHPAVSVSMDLFFMGICVIRKKQAKEHFKLRFYP